MKVFVLGDVIVDKYTRTKKLGVSAETPTMVGEFINESTFIGGAALVARNLLRLGAEVTLMSFGNDDIKDMIEASSDGFSSDEEKQRFIYVKINEHELTYKHRIFVDEYKLLQVDTIDRREIQDIQYTKILLKFILQLKNNFDAVVFCDNRHGFFNEKNCNRMIELLNARNILSFVDCQSSQSKGAHSFYNNAKYILLNFKEFTDCVLANGCLGKNNFDSIKKLQDRFNTKIIVKDGDKGSYSESEHAEGHKINFVDSCGAGDAFLAAFVLYRDIVIANIWAGLSCEYTGTIVPKLKDLDENR